MVLFPLPSNTKNQLGEVHSCIVMMNVHLKQRYGGPFTTEQVEDVKVMINIVKVLIAVCPYFLLEFTGNTVLAQYRYHKELHYSNFLHRMILENATLSPITVTIFILFLFVIIRPLNCKYTVSILKRIGAS